MTACDACYVTAENADPYVKDLLYFGRTSRPNLRHCDITAATKCACCRRQSGLTMLRLLKWKNILVELEKNKLVKTEVRDSEEHNLTYCKGKGWSARSMEKWILWTSRKMMRTATHRTFENALKRVRSCVRARVLFHMRRGGGCRRKKSWRVMYLKIFSTWIF